MNIFVYHARDALGQSIDGEISAASLEAALGQVEKKGLIPIKVKPKTENQSASSNWFERKPSAKDMATFTRQFELMFSSGISIDKILQTLARQSANETFKKALDAIREDLASGTRMSHAFAKFPQYFSSLYVNMIETGQMGGIIDKTLKETSRILQKEHYLKSKVKSATLYPKIVVVVLVGVFWGMLSFVFPTFLEFYQGFSVELPLPTRIMIALSNITTNYWHVVLAVALALYFLWRKFSQTEKGQHFIGYWAFKIPVFGRLNNLVANSRFGHLTAALYRSGVALPQSLSVVASTVDNVKFTEEVQFLIQGVKQGRALSESMRQCSFFTPMMAEACLVGEQTGRLDQVLEATSGYYDEEIDDMVANLSALIEPIMLVFLFGAVLLLALAVYMPIWNMSKVVLSH